MRQQRPSGRSRQPSTRKPAGKPAAKTAGAGKSASKSAGKRRPMPPPTRITTPRPATIPSGKRGRARRSSPRGAQRAEKRTVGGEQVEGRQAVRELLLAGARPVQEVWIRGDTEDAPILEDIRQLAQGNRVPLREVGRSKFDARARCEAPQGVLALAAPLPELNLDDLLDGRRLPSHTGFRGSPAGAAGAAPRSRQVPFLVALDGVTDPGNLGAVLRSAEGAGVTGVVLPRHRAVNVTPAATKAAAGAIEHLPVALVGGLPSALARLRDGGVLVVGLDGEAEATLYDLPPVDGPVCLVLGAEGRGLSRLVRQRCETLVRIPVHGQLASLNVSAAAALACFEVARRRG